MPQPDSPMPHLDAAERADAEHRRPPRAAVLHEAIEEIGEEELARAPSALTWSGLAAGLSMGFSMVASAALRAYLPAVPVRHLIVSIGYSTGFIIVILARQQLFTENTLTVVLPLVATPSWEKFGRMLRLWGIVLVSNLVGIAFFALAVAKAPLFSQGLRDSIAALGFETMARSPLVMFTKAVAGGWIIATIVWLMPASESSRLWIIMGLTWLIAAAGLVHIIGSAGEVCYLVFERFIPWQSAFTIYAGPTLAGNIVGGTFIFALTSHAQIRSDSR